MSKFAQTSWTSSLSSSRSISRSTFPASPRSEIGTVDAGTIGDPEDEHREARLLEGLAHGADLGRVAPGHEAVVLALQVLHAVVEPDQQQLVLLDPVRRPRPARGG
jgi:hypothetical protein